MKGQKTYICIGENFKDNAPIGDVGDAKSLIEWLKQFSRKSEDELNEFFADYTNAEVVAYILRSWGKRLKAIGGGR